MFFTLLFPSSLVLSPDPGEDPGGGGVDPGGEVLGPETLSITIDGTYRNMNLWNYLVSQFGGSLDGKTGIYNYSIFNIEFASTCLVGSNLGAGSYALTTGAFPAGSTLTITNNGTIIGGGGRGGDWGLISGTDGEDGGNGILFSTDCAFVNNNLVAAGGGGGGGGTNSFRWKDNLVYWAVGGGGAGNKGGVSGLDPDDSRVLEWTGTADNGAKVPLASNAGDGGGLGLAGEAGDGSSGGAAGVAVNEDGNTVTISGSGTFTPALA